MKNQDIIKTLVIDAPVDRVWYFLTDKDALGKWYHPAKKDLTLGENYQLFESGTDKCMIWGRVIEMEKPTKLVTSFCIPPFADHETTIHWKLEAFENGTLLTMCHKGIPATVDGDALPIMMALDNGWDCHFATLRKSAT